MEEIVLTEKQIKELEELEVQNTTNEDAELNEEIVIENESESEEE